MLITESEKYNEYIPKLVMYFQQYKSTIFNLIKKKQLKEKIIDIMLNIDKNYIDLSKITLYFIFGESCNDLKNKIAAIDINNILLIKYGSGIFIISKCNRKQNKLLKNIIFRKYV
jgi:hypothetical protein